RGAAACRATGCRATPRAGVADGGPVDRRRRGRLFRGGARWGFSAVASPGEVNMVRFRVRRVGFLSFAALTLLAAALQPNLPGVGRAQPPDAKEFYQIFRVKKPLINELKFVGRDSGGTVTEDNEG